MVSASTEGEGIMQLVKSASNKAACLHASPPEHFASLSLQTYHAEAGDEGDEEWKVRSKGEGEKGVAIGGEGDGGNEINGGHEGEAWQVCQGD